jgi:hypothetical protein
VEVRIVGVNLPGRDWACYENVHVGVQRRAEVVDLVPGDAGEAVWDFPIDVVDQDFRGPYAQGKKGDRFLYLTWGTVDADGVYRMFRRAKLMLGAIDRTTVADASQPGRRLLGTLGLTDGKGGPRCAAVRPPMIEWTAAPE